MVSKEASAEFLARLGEEARVFNESVSTKTGDWIVKGFIDVFRNVYTISGDTKVISKVLEIMLFPHFVAFAERYGYKMVIAGQQNHYPDVTFVDQRERYKFALDLKTAYRIGKGKVSRMTLGAFTGYFRNRGSAKNCTFPYAEYLGHFVLGAIYSRTKAARLEDQFKLYAIDKLERVPSVIKDIQFFAQEKYHIASDQPGSGNTKNIGGVQSIDALVNGKGPFADLGGEVFEDYWMYYLTSDMARAIDLPAPPYNNLKTYFKYKNIQKPTKAGEVVKRRRKALIVEEDCGEGER